MEWVIIASVIGLSIIAGLILKFGFLRAIISIVIGIPVGGAIGGFSAYWIATVVNIRCAEMGCLAIAFVVILIGAGIGAPIGLSLMLRMTRDKSAHSEIS